jgi:hypothetical protein
MTEQGNEKKAATADLSLLLPLLISGKSINLPQITCPKKVYAEK